MWMVLIVSKINKIKSRKYKKRNDVWIKNNLFHQQYIYQKICYREMETIFKKSILICTNINIR